jgi:hypothetical protein
MVKIRRWNPFDGTDIASRVVTMGKPVLLAGFLRTGQEQIKGE